MTVTSLINSSRQNGNGVTVAFAANIKIFAKSDLVVQTLNDTTDAVVNTLILDDAGALGFTVTFDTEAETLTVTTNTAPTSSEDILITRVIARTQTTDFPRASKFPAKSNENALDKNVLIIQDQQATIDRSLSFPTNISGITVTDLPAPTDDTVLAWDGVTGATKNSVKTLTQIEAAVDSVAALSAASGVKVSSNDTTVGFLNGKLLGGDAITLTENNDGGNETLTAKVDVNSLTDTTIAAGDEILFGDISDSNNVKKGTVQGILDLVPASGLPTGYKYGGTLSNGTDADHDIDVTAGTCRDSADATDITIPAYTKQIDASWSAGDNAGGLSSSLTLSTDTWYHVFAIVVSGAADIGFDTSVTAANLVTDHSATAYRYIGSVMTDSSSNILAFTQDGDQFIWSSPTLDVSASVGTTASSQTIKAPTGLRTLAHLTINNNGGRQMYISDLSNTDLAPGTSIAPLNHQDDPSGNRGANPRSVMTNASSQVRCRMSSTDTLRIVTRGWAIPEWP